MSKSTASSASEIMMRNINVDEALWRPVCCPRVSVERWFIATNDRRRRRSYGEIRIEDALHEIMAPARGRLTIVAAANTVVEPGSLSAQLAVDETSSRG